MAANLPTPWMGIEERINTYGGYVLWASVLAISLLRARGPSPRATTRRQWRLRGRSA